MATRSTIALEFADGTVQQVYAHWDGYLHHNGRILQQHYSDPFKLQRLIAHGSISKLDREIGNMHHFDSRVEGECTIYARDRGEQLTIQYFTDLSDYYQHCQEEEYDYILRNIKGTATWFVKCYATNGVWVTIERATLLEKLGETQ